MGVNLNDPRVRKTRRSLQEALIRLILKQGYDSISIQDIATESETARITFYRHYRDKKELLADCLNDLYEDLKDKTETISRESVEGGYSPILMLYKHIQEQESLYRILFSSRGTQTVIERLRHHVATRTMEALRASGETLVENLPEDILAYYIASAQIGLAMWWLDHNKPYPAEYMARISLWLTLSGLLEAVGISGVKLAVPPLTETHNQP